MKISKILSSLLTTGALIAASFTFMPAGPASAAAAAPSLYNMNVATQSSEGGARDFVTAGGVTYFSVNTLNKGRSIWSLAAAPGSTPELVADVAEGSVFGNPTSLSVVGNFLFFWDDATSVYDGSAPYVVNLTTKAVTELVASDDAALRSESFYGSNFVGLGGKVYFFAENNRDGNTRLRSWDVTSTDGKTQVVDELNFPASGAMTVFNDKIWFTAANSSWNTADGSVRIYDPAATTWVTVADSSSSPLLGASNYGLFQYNGAAAMVITQRVGASNLYFTVDAAGLATRLGTWSSAYGANFFVNMGTDLYVRYEPQWGSDYHFNKISTVDGELISQNSIMFPGATSVRVTSASYAGGKLFFAGNLNRTGKEQLYYWDGTNAAAQIGTYEPLGGSVWFAEYVANGGWSRNESSGVVGNSAIINLALDDSVGYEPYLLNPDGTITLVKNFNTGSEGSDPDTDCVASTATSDYVTANLPILDSQWGKDVFIETKSDGTNLKYSVLDPGSDVRNMCGYAVSGTDIYFQGDSNADGTGLYKLAADRTVTRIGSLSNDVQSAAIVNNKYYYMSDNDADLWVYDLATNTDAQLTGINASIVEADSINEVVFSGTNAAFVADEIATGNERVFIVDLTAATYAEKMVTTDVNATDWNPEEIVFLGTNIFYSDETDNSTGPKLFKAGLAGGTATLVGDLSSDNGYSERVLVVGSDIYVSHYNDATSLYELKKFTGGTTMTDVVLPTGVQAECIAPAGSSLLVASDATKVVYGISGTSVTSTGITLTDVWALCDSFVTPRGLYMAGDEYGYYNGGPFDSELLYFGTLTPVAVERLGVAVSEGPAGYAGGIPAADAVTPGAVTGLTAVKGSTTINLSWTAPTTGTTPRYLVTSTPAGAVCAVVGTTASCTGTAGVSYTFTVKAGNEAGLSAGLTTAAVVAPGGVVVPPKVNPEDPSVSSVTETKVLKNSYGLVTFPDGSGFDVDSKGRIYAKIKSTYLTSTSGTIVVNYKVGSVNKVYTCKVKPFGSLKKLKKAPTKGIVSKSKQACQLPAAAITVLKSKSVVIKATMSVKRYWATTLKAKTPAGKLLKVQARKMTVTMGKGAK